MERVSGELTFAPCIFIDRDPKKADTAMVGKMSFARVVFEPPSYFVGICRYVDALSCHAEGSV